MSYVPGARKAIDEYVVSKNYNLKICKYLIKIAMESK